jgi:hypothetical protein
MQLRLTDEEERPFAPFALVMSAVVCGIVVSDLMFWLRATDHRPTLTHAPGYAAVLVAVWLSLALVSRSGWLRAAWLLLALNEVLSALAAWHPEWSPGWRPDALLIAWTGAICVWGWQRSPAWLRILAVLLFAGGIVFGQSMLTVERLPGIKRPALVGKPK